MENSPKTVLEKQIVYIFICEIKPKNLLQLEILKKNGFEVTVFVHSNLEKSIRFGGALATIRLLKNDFISRIRQLHFFMNRKDRIAHFEIYGGSRFAFIYLLFAKLHNIKVLNIERGAISEYIDKKSNLNKLARISMFLLYKFSDFTWYKEYYMEKHLIRLGAKNLVFIPNTIHQRVSKIPSYSQRKIDYLWVNRIIPMRHVEWVINLAMIKEFRNKSFVLCGFLDDDYSRKIKNFIQQNNITNIEILNYTENVFELYGNSRYFLLPADYVFGNNALLESMSVGVVPAVSNVEGTHEIVVDQMNGLSFENKESEFIAKMKETLDISNEAWSIYSNQSINMISSKYNNEIFESKLIELYKSMH